MTIAKEGYFVNAGQALRDGWPKEWPTPPEQDLLDNIYLGESELVRDEGRNVFTFDTNLLLLTQIGFTIPGVPDLAIVFGAKDRNTVLPFHLEIRPEQFFSVSDVPLAIRLPKSLLKPARRAEATEPNQPAVWELDPTREFPDITIARASFEVNGSGDISFDVDGVVDLPPVMLGESGIVVQARNITFHLDPTQAPVGFRGILLEEATLALPGELGELVGELAIENASIGTGGFSGTVADTFTPGKATRFFGLDFLLEHVEIALVQNAFTGAMIRGQLTLPFFQETVSVEISFTLNGDYSIRLTEPGGLATLEKPEIFRLVVESVGFVVEDGLFSTVLSGKLTPTLQADVLDWPTLEVRELVIDSDGHVRLEGGWLDLPDSFTLDFHGFQFEITKLGFGRNDDGSKWIGMNGALRLLDGLQAGASVEGLRLTWFEGQPASLSLEGVGVELEIANALRFKGFVAFRDLPEGGKRFDGDIKLELSALDLSIDAQLVFGHANSPDGSYNFMGIFLGVELPAGIPLFTTGLGLYGMSGLFASQLAPDKAPEEQWYDDWYKKDPVGVTELVKWTNQRDALGLGMGVTIGTLADNGYAFSGRLLLLLLLPGPVIMIEGRANILKERSKLSDEPIFKTLAVLDFNAGTFVFGVDAQYRYDDGGRLITIGGSAEAYFNINNPGDWHFWLGQKDPRDKRLRASIFSLFEANAYFMLDASSVAMGAWLGWNKSWKFGPLRVSAELWAEGDVGVSWRPPQFTGGLRLHGGVHLRAFGIGLGLSVEVGASASVFDPFHVLGSLHVELETPWPLPNVGATIKLEWGPQPTWPRLPLPLSEAAVEHIKVTTSWPLQRAAGLLAPNYDSGGGLRDVVSGPAPPVPPDPIDDLPPPAGVPVVPMDGRPRLTFTRPIQDEALVGVNVRVSPQYELIGNPAKNEGQVKVAYSLREVRLEKYLPATTSEPTPHWETVARKAADDLGANDDGVETLFGSWAPIPDFSATDGTGDAGGHVQVKLWLWSANPFDYTRRVGRSWDETFVDRYPDYPCITVDSPQEHCVDFESIPTDTPLDNGTSSVDPYVPSYRHPDNPDVELIVDDAVIDGVPLVQVLPSALDGHLRGVCFTPLPAAVTNAPPPPTTSPLINGLLFDLTGVSPVPAGNKALMILVPTPNVGVRLVISPQANVIAFDEANVVHAAATPPRSSDIAEILVDNLKLIVAYWNTDICLAGVCEIIGPTPEQTARVGLAASHNVDAVEHFEDRGFVFDAHSDYRLRIVTKIDAKGMRELQADNSRIATQTEFAFFRTEGPPKLADLTIPAGREGDDELKLRNVQGDLVRNDGTVVGDPGVLATQLNELGIYVRQTLPATVPAAKERPDLPRPVYRAYDLGMEFNENYVQLMYRLDGRDLALYLLDQNEQPVRDAEGRLLVLRSGWDVSANPIVDTAETTWTTTLQASTCAGSVAITLERDEVLKLSGATLDPDTIYDARLSPLALHEDFNDADIYQLDDSAAGTDATLGRFTVEDQGGGSGTSTWVIAERGDPPVRLVKQTSDYSAGSSDGLVPEKPGTVLWLHDRSDLPTGHRDQPSSYSDSRLTVILRSEDDDAIGLIFRRESAARYYRFSMDRERKYRRLTLHYDGVVRILAEDEFVYELNVDYEVAIEALGAELAVFVDGERVLSATDGSIAQGTVGLYAWSLQGGMFSDIRIDDFRATAPAAYLYRFTTSRFSNFAHEVQSYQDETWIQPIDSTTAALLAPAVPSAQAPSPAEHRAWDALEASTALDPLLRTRVEEVQAVRLVLGTSTPAFLLRSPEPLDVARTTLQVFRSTRAASGRRVPGALKLTQVARGTTEANQEWVGAILRDTVDPSGFSIEQRRLTPLLFLPNSGEVLLDEQFDGRPHGRLYTETFGPNALDLYQILDEGTSDAPSAWSIDSGTLKQTSNIYSGPANAGNLAKLGTMALRGRDDWGNVRLRVVVESNDNDSVGVVFRYRDAGNYYRFELNRNFGYRRLIKKQAGTVTLLAEDSTLGYDMGVDYELEVIAFGTHLVGFVNRVLAFAVTDDALELGRVGLYCWGNNDTTFKVLEVDTADAEPFLQLPPTNLSGFETVDEGDTGGPSAWQVSGTTVTQPTSIRGPSSDPKVPGTNLVGGLESYADVRVSTRMSSGDGHAIGLLFRHVDGNNTYRFSMDSTAGYRRLIKIVDGTVTSLWEDTVAYGVGSPHDVTVVAHGTRLEVWLDGTRIAAVIDGTHAIGRIGLYTANEDSASFAAWTVIDDTKQVGRWAIVDDGLVGAPSDWRIASGVLQQRSNIQDGQDDPAAAEKAGTMAVGGRPDWSDYRLSVELRAEDDDALGVVFRYIDRNNYYRFSADKQRSYRRLIKRTVGVVTVLWQDTNSYDAGVTFTLTVDAVGSRFKGYVDNTLVFNLADDAHPSGRVGVYAWAHDDLRVSQLSVVRPSVETTLLFEDKFGAGSSAEFSIVDKGTTNAPSSWSVVAGELRQTSNIFSGPTGASDPPKEGTYAVAGDPTWGDVAVRVELVSGDDDAIGVMFRYVDDNNYYRFSMDHERAYRRLVSKKAGVFRVLWEDHFPFELGRTYDLVLGARGDELTGYIDEVPVFRVLDDDHAQGRIALYCWGNTDAHFASVQVYPGLVLERAFTVSDDFIVLSDGSFQFVDEGSVGAPSSWEVTEGELRQTSQIRDNNGTSRLGSNGLHTKFSGADCQVTAIMRSSSGGGMGLVFRENETGYYRFSVDRSQGTRYLLKKVGAAYTVLFSEAFVFDLDTEYVLSMICIGSALRGYVNGVPVFSVSDSSHTSGRAGLYVHENSGAAFLRFDLLEPAWIAYYRFAKEQALAAGTRLKIFSGRASDPFTSDPLDEVRHVASSFEHGVLAFGSDKLELRAVENGNPVHEREFLPDAAYTAVPVRLLRRADGTGYAIVPEGSASFTEGDYRFHLEYRREDSFQTLSERGQTTAEVAVIDVPWEAKNDT
jgi:hypothetical protein